jgi:hypothetical protein
MTEAAIRTMVTIATLRTHPRRCHCQKRDAIVSIPTTRICRGWPTRLSLSKTGSKRWRRMARGKCHSWDSLREATPGLACLSQGLSLETRVRFTRWCMDSVLHSRCSDRISKRSVQTTRYRNLSHRLLNPMCSNHLAKTYRKTLTQLLHPCRMH